MKRLLPAIVLLFLVWTAWTAVTQVNPGERAVVSRFGRVLDDKPMPGLYVGLPWGIDRVTKVKVGEPKVVHVGFNAALEPDPALDAPPGQLLTGDHNLVNLQAAVNYTIIENEVAGYALHKDRVDAIVEHVAEAAMARWVAGRGVDEVLLRGKGTLPHWLKEEVQRVLTPYAIGVRVDAVSLGELSPPAEVKADFDAVARAQTEIRTLKNGAEQQADKAARETASEIYHIKQLADAYRSEQLLVAAAEAQAFEKHMKQYHELSEQNPYYLAGLWLNDMSRLYQKMRDNGRIDLLDYHLSGNTLNITQMPLMPRK